MRSFFEGSTCLISEDGRNFVNFIITWKSCGLFGKTCVWGGECSSQKGSIQWWQGTTGWNDFQQRKKLWWIYPKQKKLCSRLWVGSVIWFGKRKRVLRLFLKSISAEFGRFNQKLVAKSQVWSLEDPKKSSAQVKISVLTTGFPDFVPDSWSVADLWPLLSFISLLGAIRSCLSFTLWSSNGGWIAGLGSQRTCRGMCTVTPNGAGWVHWKWLV